MRFTGIIFDLDGTLLDTLTDISDAANRVLQSHGLPTHDEDTYRYLVGEGVATLFTRAVPDHRRHDEQLLASCIADFHEVYDQHWNVKTRAYAGVEEMLGELAQRHLKLAVLSNKPQAFTQSCMDYYLSDFAFEPIFGQREGMPKKPDPAGALEIAGHWGIPIDRWLYVGDTSTDMQTARNAGMTAVGVLWGFRTRDELVEHGAARIVEHPHEIVALIDNPDTFISMPHDS